MLFRSFHLPDSAARAQRRRDDDRGGLVREIKISCCNEPLRTACHSVFCLSGTRPFPPSSICPPKGRRAPERYCPARKRTQASASPSFSLSFFFSVIVIARSGQIFSHWRQPMQSCSRTGVDFRRSLNSSTDLGQTPTHREHPLHHAMLTPTLNCF